jgi:hypothetical protein
MSSTVDQLPGTGQFSVTPTGLGREFGPAVEITTKYIGGRTFYSTTAYRPIRANAGQPVDFARADFRLARRRPESRMPVRCRPKALDHFSCGATGLGACWTNCAVATHSLSPRSFARTSPICNPPRRAYIDAPRTFVLHQYWHSIDAKLLEGSLPDARFCGSAAGWNQAVGAELVDAIATQSGPQTALAARDAVGGPNRLSRVEQQTPLRILRRHPTHRA